MEHGEVPTCFEGNENAQHAHLPNDDTWRPSTWARSSISTPYNPSGVWHIFTPRMG